MDRSYIGTLGLMYILSEVPFPYGVSVCISYY